MKLHLYLFVCLTGGFGLGLFNGIIDHEDFVEQICELPPRQLCQPPLQQEPERLEDEITDLFVFVQNMPRFFDASCEELPIEGERKQCAEEKMLQFIYQNLKYPPIARETAMEGMVVIRFVVNKEGKIESPEIVRNPSAPLGEEALRVVKLMPDWIPGRQRGKPVKVQFNLPVRFKLED